MARESRKYDPEQIETKWQKVWDEQKTFVVANPEPGSSAGRQGRRRHLRARDVPLSFGQRAHGARQELHHGRRHRPLPPPSGPAGAASHGVRRLRPQLREHGHQDRRAAGQVHRRGHRHHQPAAAPPGRVHRLDPRGGHLAGPSTTSGPSGSSCSSTRRAWPTRRKRPVNWCPSCQTVLANEQVIEGACERCDTVVEAKKLTQWFFRITDYAERLLQDFDKLESWPERVITMQRNWIGKSTGADVVFAIAPARRADGGLGAGARAAGDRGHRLHHPARHALRGDLLHPGAGAPAGGRPGARALPRRPRSSATWPRPWPPRHIERASMEKEKTGVFTGRYAVNPVTGGHDPHLRGRLRAHGLRHRRHHGRARPRRARLRLRQEVRAGGRSRSSQSPDEFKDADGRADRRPTRGDGLLVNSGQFDGLPKAEGIVKVTEWLKEQGKADFAVNYKLRDWLLSRQRYWGAPIPIIYCDDVRRGAGARRPAAGAAARHHRLRAQGQVAPGRRRAVGQHHLPAVRRPGPARDRHHGHLRRLLLVLPALRLALAGRRGLRPRRRSTTGCRWTSTSAGWSTPSCT